MSTAEDFARDHARSARAHTRLAASHARFARAQAAVVATNRAAIAAVLPLMAVAGVTAAIEDTAEGPRFTLRGATGVHGLFLSHTDLARALAHWEGFAFKNGGGWAKIRPLCRDEARDCACCGEGLDVGQYVLAADFGVFCSGACGETFRAELAEAAGDDA